MIKITAQKDFSDLDFFKHSIYRDSVFRKLDVLDFSYIPDKLFMRNDVIKSLIFTFRRLVFEENLSTNCLLIGPAGSGKTTIAQFFSKNFREIALEIIPNFHIIYFNCFEFRSKNAIVKQLVKEFCYSDGKGLGSEEFLLVLIKKLLFSKKYLFVILDNVDHLPQNDLLQILNLSESFGHQNVRISFLFISRDKEWAQYKNQELIQKIHEIIKIKPYTFEEAFLILTKRCESVFKENIISEDLIRELARIVVKTKNMRYSIEYLRRLGIYADKERFSRITSDMLKEIPEIPYFKFIEVLESLKEHELFTLYSVLTILAHSKTATTEEMYSEYQNICKKYNKPPRHITTLRKYLQKLDKFNLLKRNLVKLPLGNRHEISLPYDSNGIQKEIEMYLNQKLT